MKKNTKELNVLESEDFLKLTTTAARVRYLDSLNFTRSDIAKMLNIRYQHVRNTLVTLLKKDFETFKGSK